MNKSEEMLDRAAGTLIGQCAGDNLGARVEFRSREAIVSEYPEGISVMADGGTWSIMAGQATDDSELALALARSIIRKKSYDANDVYTSYQRWYHSDPFDCGGTIAQGLRGYPNGDSQANGALMRVSPLGIFSAASGLPYLEVYRLAAQDAAMTHPHAVCVDINKLFVRALALSIEQPVSPSDLHELILTWSGREDIDPVVRTWTRQSLTDKPVDYSYQMGHVRIAWQNALWQLRHASSVEQAVADTISEGGDTDTNAAICGALLGAVYGASNLPSHWLSTLSACHPDVNEKRTRHPRDEEYWPCDVVSLAEQLLDLSTSYP